MNINTLGLTSIHIVTLTTYHILLAEFGELPMKLCALKLAIGFQQQLAHLPSPYPPLG